MKIEELYGGRTTRYSIEVFPPKNGGSLESLLSTVENLSSLKPTFVSVTYGAMGNARGGTVELASMIKRRYGLETAAHITAVGKSKQELENLLVGANYAGIGSILALRGDPKQGTAFKKHKDGHKYAYQLVEQIRSMNEGNYLQGKGEKTNFSLGVACYPEGHKDNPRKNNEPLYLKIKQDAGADFAITQMVFDNEKYLRFMDQADSIGVTIPIIPGIMPIKDLKSVAYFKETFGVTIPEDLVEEMNKHKNNVNLQKETGIRHALKQCKELTSKGVPGIHFYTMNRPETTKRLINSL